MISIVTDSTAYLSWEEARQMGVRLVPISYTVNRGSYNETYADKNGNFDRLIALSGGECRVTTSQTTLPVFLSVFDELLRRGDEVLCITLSSRLSGTYSSASAAARNLSSDRVHVFDSMQIAGGTFILIQEAAAMIRKNCTMEAILERLMELRTRMGIVFSVSDMGPLRRSGRLGIVPMSVGTVLNLRPILKLYEGGVVSDSVARGRHAQIRQLVERIPANASRLIAMEVTEGHAGRQLREKLQERFPDIPIEYRLAGPVLGIHLGMDAIGVVWET